ncbi:MAG TPA: response regulator [Verrucomicrobiae bacterium]|nr:response regulator [Verrucomicrobiae bacterium]
MEESKISRIGESAGEALECRGTRPRCILTMEVEPARVPVQCRTSPPPRILVVEDEPDIRRLNAEVLKSFGYNVDTAEDGEAGWKALRAVRHAPESYALLITDHDMPGLTGLALVKKLRAARLALPVIMATGRLLPEDLFTRYGWLQPGAALIKPYSVEQLLGTVQAVLHTAEGAREQMASPPNWLTAGGLRF